MFVLTCRVGAHNSISCYAHDTRLYPISDEYNYIIRDDISLFVEHSFESVFVEVLINNAVNIIVGEMYRVQNSNRQLSIQYYEDIISKF